jgi:hypothetical protein
MKERDQIAYVPRHANNDLNHPDVEFGFIMSVENGHCFCRFWWGGQPGILRTTSCSESVNNTCLFKYDCVSQDIVNDLHYNIRKEMEEQNG